MNTSKHPQKIQFSHRLTIRRKASGRKVLSALFSGVGSKFRAESSAMAFLTDNPELMCEICPVASENGGGK